MTNVLPRGSREDTQREDGNRSQWEVNADIPGCKPSVGSLVKTSMASLELLEQCSQSALALSSGLQNFETECTTTLDYQVCENLL